jgi:hypothetical protein
VAHVLLVFLIAILLFTVSSTVLTDFTPPPPSAKVSGLKLVWFVMETLYTETSSLRTLKIMLRNLNEIVHS